MSWAIWLCKRSSRLVVLVSMALKRAHACVCVCLCLR